MQKVKTAESKCETSSSRFLFPVNTLPNVSFMCNSYGGHRGTPNFTQHSHLLKSLRILKAQSEMEDHSKLKRLL